MIRNSKNLILVGLEEINIFIVNEGFFIGL